MTWPGIEPGSPGPLVNTLPTGPMKRYALTARHEITGMSLNGVMFSVLDYDIEVSQLEL